MSARFQHTKEIGYFDPKYHPRAMSKDARLQKYGVRFRLAYPDRHADYWLSSRHCINWSSFDCCKLSVLRVDIEEQTVHAIHRTIAKARSATPGTAMFVHSICIHGGS